MSVPKYKRQQSKFELINKATAITAYTLKMCSNEKIFPKRYRWCITDKLVDTMLEMGKDIKIANSIKVSDSNDFAMRKAYQTRALAATNAIFNLMDVAYGMFDIEDSTIDYWTGAMLEVQTLLKNWRTADIERYKDI